MKRIHGRNQVNKDALLKVVKGGTSSSTPPEATTTLSVLSTDDLNTPSGVASLDTGYKISTSILQTGSYDSADSLDNGSVSGQLRVRYDTDTEYIITDYNETSVYTVSCDIGSVTMQMGSDKVVYRWPSILVNLNTSPNIGFYLNGRFIRLVPVTEVIETPTIITPNLTSNVGEGGVSIKSSAFNITHGNTVHTSTDWEIYEDERLISLVWSSYENANSKTDINSTAKLSNNKSYWCRVRYRGEDSLIYSEWSNLSKFNIVYIVIDKPVMTLPIVDQNNKRIIEQTSLGVSTSTMLLLSGTATHIATQYKLYKDATRLTVISEGSVSSAPLTSLSITASMGVNTSVYLEFRYITSVYGSFSPWSDLYEFTTKDNVVGPSTIIYPINLSSNLPRTNIKLLSTTSTAFPLSGQHTKTEWEVSDNIDFLNVMFSSRDDTVNLDSIFVPGPFDAAKTLFARCRYFDSGIDKWGAWSNVTQFSTANIPIVKPFILSPLSGQTAISMKEIEILASNFSIDSNLDTHDRTDWEIQDSNGNVVNSSYNDKTNLTSIKMTIADIPGTYTLRLRYKTKNFNAVSPWSDDFVYTITGKLYNEKLLLNGQDGDISCTGNCVIGINGAKPGAGVTISLYDELDAPITISSDSVVFKGTIDDNGAFNSAVTITPSMVPNNIVKVKAIFDNNKHVRKSNMSYNYNPVMKMNGVVGSISTKDPVAFSITGGKPKGKFSYAMVGTKDPSIKYTELDNNGNSSSFAVLKYDDTVNSPITANVVMLYDQKTLSGNVVNDRPNYTAGDLVFVIDGDSTKDYVNDASTFTLTVKNGTPSAKCRLYMFEQAGHSSWNNNADNSKVFDSTGSCVYTGLVTNYSITQPTQITVKAEGSVLDVTTNQYLLDTRLVGTKVIRVLPKVEETGNEKLQINSSVSTKSQSGSTNLNSYIGFTLSVTGVKPNTPIQISCDSLWMFVSPFNATTDSSGKYTATLTTDKMSILTNTTLTLKIGYITPITIKHNLVISAYTPTGTAVAGSGIISRVDQTASVNLAAGSSSLTTAYISTLNSINADTTTNSYILNIPAGVVKVGSVVTVTAKQPTDPYVTYPIQASVTVNADGGVYGQFNLPATWLTVAAPYIVCVSYLDFAAGTTKYMYCKMITIATPTIPPPATTPTTPTNTTSYSPKVTFNGAEANSNITLNTGTDINLVILAGSPNDAVGITITSTTNQATINRSLYLDSTGSNTLTIKSSEISSLGTSVTVVILLTKGSTTKFSAYYVFSDPKPVSMVSVRMGLQVEGSVTTIAKPSSPGDLSLCAGEASIMFAVFGGPPGGNFKITIKQAPTNGFIYSIPFTFPTSIQLMQGGSYFHDESAFFLGWAATNGANDYDYIHPAGIGTPVPFSPFSGLFMEFMKPGQWVYAFEFSDGNTVTINVNVKQVPTFELKILSSLNKLVNSYDYPVSISSGFKPNIVLAGPLAESLQGAYVPGSTTTQKATLPATTYPIYRQYLAWVSIFTEVAGVRNYVIQRQSVVISGKNFKLPNGVYSISGCVDSSTNTKYAVIPMEGIWSKVSLSPNTRYYFAIDTHGSNQWGESQITGIFMDTVA